MDYICKDCENPAVAADMDEILSYRKLCGPCLSDSNRKMLVRTKPKKSKNRGNNGKKSKEFTFVCSYCQHDAKVNYRPWFCTKCNKNTFYRVVL